MVLMVAKDRWLCAPRRIVGRVFRGIREYESLCLYTNPKETNFTYLSASLWHRASRDHNNRLIYG